MIAPKANRARFLQALFPDRLGYAHLFTSREGEAAHDVRLEVNAYSAIERFVTSRADRNIYIGIAARRTADNGTLENCTTLAALFAEIDFKDFTDEAEARAKLASFRIPPNIVIFSGGGLHCYWLLTEPMDYADGGAAQVKRRLRALARAVGGDLKAAEPARVLRVPDTKNVKYDPPRDVTVEHFDADHRHDLADLDAVLDIAAEPEVPYLVPRDRQPIDHGLGDDVRVQRAAKWLATQQPAVQGSLAAGRPARSALTATTCGRT